MPWNTMECHGTHWFTCLDGTLRIHNLTASAGRTAATGNKLLRSPHNSLCLVMGAARQRTMLFRAVRHDMRLYFYHPYKKGVIFSPTRYSRLLGDIQNLLIFFYNTPFCKECCLPGTREAAKVKVVRLAGRR